MNCKACKKQIEADSLYCKYCGERQVKERKKKSEVSVPKPSQRSSGKWVAQLMIDGERVYISADSEKEYYAKAKAVKTGLLKQNKAVPAQSLRSACNDFISKRNAILSPSTILGYDTITRTRFQAYMDKDIRQIDYQEMLNKESAIESKPGKKLSAKTVINSWGFIKSVLKENKVEIPDVALPQIIPKELPWLQPEQIPLFLDAIKNTPVELAALLALHGLRRSELYALTPADIYDGVIHVRGAVVRDINNELVHKDTTKNVSSRRDVTIRIPRLQQLIDADTRSDTEQLVTSNINNIHTSINNICRASGLPEVGVHGLRRSFASLAYSLGWSEKQTMKEGGWSDKATMDKKYIKLAEADAQKQSDSMKEYYARIAETSG